MRSMIASTLAREESLDDVDELEDMLAGAGSQDGLISGSRRGSFRGSMDGANHMEDILSLLESERDRREADTKVRLAFQVDVSSYLKELRVEMQEMRTRMLRFEKLIAARTVPITAAAAATAAGQAAGSGADAAGSPRTGSGIATKKFGINSPIVQTRHLVDHSPFTSEPNSPTLQSVSRPGAPSTAGVTGSGIHHREALTSGLLGSGIMARKNSFVGTDSHEFAKMAAMVEGRRKSITTPTVDAEALRRSLSPEKSDRARGRWHRAMRHVKKTLAVDTIKTSRSGASTPKDLVSPTNASGASGGDDKDPGEAWGSPKGDEVRGAGRLRRIPSIFRSASGGTKTAETSFDTELEALCDIYQYPTRRPGKFDYINVRRCIFSPDTTWQRWWQLFIMLLTIFYVLKVPFYLALDPEFNPWLSALDIVADCCYLIDIAISFRTAYRDKWGDLVFNSHAIAVHYGKGWFVLDFFASIPLSFFDVGEGAKANKLLRLTKLFKLLRMFRMQRYMRRIEEIMPIQTFRIVKSLAVLVVWQHFLGCAYWGVAAYSSYGGIQVLEGTPCLYMTQSTVPVDSRAAQMQEQQQIEIRSIQAVPESNALAPSENQTEFTCFVNECIYYGTCPKISRLANAWVPHPSIISAGILDQYMQAIFWAVTATTGIGYDIIPTTSVEVAFTWVMVFVGLVVYSLVLGSAASALQNINSESAHRQRTMERVGAYLKTRSIPDFFKKVVMDYYEHVMKAQSNSEEKVFAELPQSLRARLMLLLNRETMRRIPIFADFPADLFIKLIQRLQPITFLPGEYIVHAKKTCRAMYFVDRGRIDITEPPEDSEKGGQEKFYQTLKTGDFFGEKCVIFHTIKVMSRRSARSVDYTDVLKLARTSVQELVKIVDKPTFYEFTQKIARVASVRDESRTFTMFPRSRGRSFKRLPLAAPAGSPATSPAPVTRQVRRASWKPSFSGGSTVAPEESKEVEGKGPRKGSFLSMTSSKPQTGMNSGSFFKLSQSGARVVSSKSTASSVDDQDEVDQGSLVQKRTTWQTLRRMSSRRRPSGSVASRRRSSRSEQRRRASSDSLATAVGTRRRSTGTETKAGALPDDIDEVL